MSTVPLFRFLVLSAALLTGGCYLSKPSETAESPKVLWKEPSDTPQQELPPVTQPPGAPYDLGKAIDTALQNNPNTRSGWLAARAAAYGKKASYSELYPQLDGSVKFGRARNEFNGTTFVEQRTATTPGLSLRYTLFDFGARFSSISIADETLKIANFQYNRTVQETLFEVQRRYFLLHATEAAVRANEETINEAKRSLEAAQKSFEIGLKPKQDVLQAEASLKRAEYERDDAKAAVEDARALFAEVLGVPVASRPDVQPPDFTALEQRTPAGDPESLIRQALLSRPDLKAVYSEARLEGDRADLVFRQSLPRLVSTMNGTENYIYGSSGKEQNYDIGVELQIPIFTGFKDTYAIKQQREVALQAVSQNKAKELSVEREVWSSYFRFDAALRQTHAARALVSATTESYRAVEQGYRNGSNSVLDLLAAQRELSDARKNLISAEATCAISFATLELATGKLEP